MMGVVTKLIFLIVTVLVVYSAMQVSNILFEVPPIPDLKDEWWGPGAPTKEDTAIKPFKINVPEQVITDLQQRLSRARPLTPSLEGTQHYGINANLLKEILDFWRTKYNWREREQFLNKYPQYTTSIQGLNIHFLHVKPTTTKGLRTLPLLLLHGWPGSVREFYEIIPLLTTPQKNKDFVFEVIVASLPGYGFSEGASKPGLGAVQMAVVFKNLMRRLGFEKFYLQGGDWGALIVSNMATLYPQHVLGVHANMCTADSPIVNLKLLLGSIYPPLFVDKVYEERLYPLSTFFSNIMLELGYLHLQATKPDTVGVGLNDSPAGLAAYIIEKFTTWTNPEWKNRKDGGLKNKFSYTNLLDNVMIYWVTNSITTSARLYSESFNKAQLGLKMGSIPIKVPSACSKFKYELANFPDDFLAYKYPNLVYSVVHTDGGHFAAFEVPDVLAKDIWISVEKFEEHNKKK